MSGVNLFCFPYAGGSAMIYHAWEKKLDRSIRLVPVELAGRGRRTGHPLYKNIGEAVEDALEQMAGTINESPYALFGHSLGGLIIYELAQKIRRLGIRMPVHCFFSGKPAPHLAQYRNKLYHLMEDEEFKKALLALGGTPREFFDNQELLDLFLPLLRNDFMLAETGKMESAVHPLPFDITVLLGKTDDLSAEQCDGWKEHTQQLCSLHYFDGGHFFLHDHGNRIVQIINQTLKEVNSERSLLLTDDHTTY
jgi:medium-chain acyl-[acyl-carrier-protein] hydrolase